jgi:hypothetical protein
VVDGWNEYGTDQASTAGGQTLCASDGRQFKILHPEFIMVGKGAVVVLRDDDLVETVDALHIVSVEDINAAAA